jgi:hypothetical protein
MGFLGKRNSHDTNSADCRHYWPACHPVERLFFPAFKFFNAMERTHLSWAGAYWNKKIFRGVPTIRYAMSGARLNDDVRFQCSILNQNRYGLFKIQSISTTEKLSRKSRAE